MPVARQFVEHTHAVAAAVALGLLVALLLAVTTVARSAEEGADADGDHASTIINSSHALSIAKLGTPNPVPAGSVLTYWISYTVTGDEIAPDAVISDPVPFHSTFMGCDPACSFDAGVATWELGTVPPGMMGEVALTVLVEAPLFDGTLLTNTAWIHDSTDLFASVVITTVVQADHTLSIEKTDSVDPVQAGALLEYVLTYQVTGNEIAPNIVITDALPANTVFESCAPACSADGGVVAWTLGTLAPGSGQVTTTVLIDPSTISGTLLSNQAWIMDDDGKYASVVETTGVTAGSQAAELAVTKTVTPLAVLPGAPVEYTIRISNQGGGVANGVDVVDNLPPGFDPLSRQWNNQVITDEWVQTFQATAGAMAGTYSNVVTVTWGSDVITTGPTAPVLVDDTRPDSTITSLPDLTNLSPIPIDWQANDPEPGSGLAETCLWYKLETSGTWTCTTPCLGGTPRTFHFVPPGGQTGTFYLATVATDKAGNSEPIPQGDSPFQTLYDPVPPESNAAAPATAAPDTVIEVTWTATDTLSGVDSVILWVRHGPTGAWELLAGSEVTDSFKFVPPQPQGIYYFETVATDAAGNEEVRQGGDGDTSTQIEEMRSRFVYLPAVTRSYLPPAPDLSTSQKTANRAAVEPGDVIEYTIELANTGQAPAPFILTDRIPDDTILVAVDEKCAGDNRIEWNGTLPPGSSDRCHFSVRVDPNPSSTIANTAVLTDVYHARRLLLTANNVGVLSWHPGQGFPPGTTVYSVASCPGCDTLYTGTRNEGVWTSVDGGVSWSPLGLSGESVRSVSVAPDCAAVYATAWGNGVLKYAGGAWSPANNGLGDLYLYAVLSVDANTLYVGTSSAGVYRSVDAGASWQQASAGLPENSLVYALAASPTDPPTLYAGTWGGGVFMLDPGAASWTPLNTGLDAPWNITALAVHPTNPAIMYAATEQHGVYRWNADIDAWVSEWGRGDGGSTGRIAYTVAVGHDGTAYLGSDSVSNDGIWRRSLDGTWHPVPRQPGANPTVRAIVVPPPGCLSTTSLWVGTTDGAWRYGVE
ncbi:MAG: DUF11 domain-containing protein [Anaerolineae bacterium]|nr:DUF11 domain-containing protein [Anaerolineae bacterium]